MIGTRVDKYEIKQLIGSGGMGAVYLVEHVQLRKPLAMKVLLPELSTNPMIVKRFENEALAVATIKNSHIPAVYDIGQLPNGQHYIVLDYLEGGTLGQYMRSVGGPLAIDHILRLVFQLLDAVHVAHERGIVHRDIKPENIFLTASSAEEHHLYLLDFGIAKLRDQALGMATRSGVLIGTPGYMSPEQMRGHDVGPTSDIYSIGVVLYQLGTGGYLPHQDAGPPFMPYQIPESELVLRQLHGPAPDPRRHVPSLPQAWVEANQRALDPNPARRPQNASELALVLADAYAGDEFTDNGRKILKDTASVLLVRSAGQQTIRAVVPVQAPISQPAGPPGSAVGSRFQLGPKLGEGGMAEVFRGSLLGAEGFSREVAIKRVHHEYARDRAFASMFIDEGRIAAQLQHPNIVSVLALERDPEGALFIAMELVEGCDLANLMETGGIPPAVLIFIFTEMLRGLGYAHEFTGPSGQLRGVIHRDVSPQNVLISWTAAVKLSDFGLAKAREASSGSVSRSIKGKPAYMSPEQANGEHLDGRSDLWAVGVMLWELLAGPGQRLFQGSHKEVFAQVFFRELARPSDVRRDGSVPRDLEAIAMKLLERERDRRYATADDVIADLRRCADASIDGRGELASLLEKRFPKRFRATGRDGTGSVRPAAVMTAADPPSTLGGAASQSSRRPRATRGRRWLPWLALPFGLAAGILGFMAIDARGHHDSSATEHDDAAVVALPADARAREVTTDGPTVLVVAPRPAVDAGAPALPARPDAGPTHPATPIVKPAIVTHGPVEQGELSVYIDPWADIYIDGRKKGSTPLVRATVPVGVHQIKLVNEGAHHLETKTVTVVKDKETVIDETW